MTAKALDNDYEMPTKQELIEDFAWWGTQQREFVKAVKDLYGIVLREGEVAKRCRAIWRSKGINIRNTPKVPMVSIIRAVQELRKARKLIKAQSTVHNGFRTHEQVAAVIADKYGFDERSLYRYDKKIPQDIEIP